MSKSFFLPLILTAGVLAFFFVAQREAPVVWDYYEHPTAWLRDFMSQSIYEGGFPGGSDVGVTFAIVCFFDWIFRKRGSKKIFSFLTESNLKFIWLTSLITSLLTVHGLKWLISRARPKMIFTPDFISQNGSLEVIKNMSWPGFLPWDGPRGYSFNSFPSGHTASCAILLTVTYLLFRQSRTWGIVSFIIILLYCASMAVARSMAGMHWLSDSVASFFICWAVIHFRAGRESRTRQ